MNKPLLTFAMLAMAAYGQAQVQVGRTFAVDMHEGLNDRGTDTLVTFGVDQAVAAGQIAGYVTPGGGMLFGPSEFPTEQFAQEFELIDGPANIDGIVFLFASRVYGSNDPASHVKARLFAMDAAGGQTSQGAAQRPGTVLAEVELPVEETTDMGFSGVSFAPIWVSGSFAAGFSLDGLNSSDSLNLAATTNGFVEISDRSWLTLGGAWATVLLATTDPNTPGSGLDIDYFVGAVLTPSAVSVGEEAWMNGMQMDLLGSHPNRDAFIVRYAVRESADLRLFILDAAGRTMVDEPLGRRSGEHQHPVNTQDWAAGTYFVNLVANGKPITKRIVVE